MRRPSPEDGKSCRRQRSNGIGCVNREVAGHGPKKNARPLENLGSSARRGYRRGSHRPAPSVDRQTTGANHPGVAAVGHCRQSPDRAAVARSIGVCLARQLQITLRIARATGPTVAMHRPAETAFCARLSADHQRGPKKEGTGRQLQESRPRVEPGSDRRQGS